MRTKLWLLAAPALTAVIACLVPSGALAAAETQAARLAVEVGIPGGVTAVAAQGNMAVALGPALGSVIIVDSITGSIRSTSALPSTASGVALSLDGSSGFVATDSQIFVLDTATGSVVRSKDYGSETMPNRVLGGEQPCGSALGMKLRSPAMSPDGRHLNFIGDCQGWPVLWSIDPVTMSVTSKSFTYLGRGGLGFPIGPLAAFDDRVIVNGRKPDDYCLNVNNCGPGSIVITSRGDIEKGFQYGSKFPAGPFSALTRDPVAGSLLASKVDALVWVDPESGMQTRSIEGVGSNVTDLKVDSSTGLIYARDDQGTVVVDPAAGQVSGMLMEALDAVSGGRGYHATATGVDIIDVRSGFVATRPRSVAAKVGRPVNGTVKATLNWQPPTSAGSSPVTGYRVQASAYRNAKDKKPTVMNDRVSAGATSSRLTIKQVRSTDAKSPAFYAFTVTPINAIGDGAYGSAQVAAPRR